MLKMKLKGTISENFLATGGFFEHNTYRMFATLKQLLHIAINTPDYGKLLDVLLDASICSPAMISL